MYERKYKVLLGEKISETKHSYSDTHSCTSVSRCFLVKYVQDILRSFCNKNQAHQVLQRYYVCITDSDHDYILDEILRQDQIEYERKIKIEDYTD